MPYYLSHYLKGGSDYHKGLSLFNDLKANLEMGLVCEVDFTDAGGVSSSFLHGFLGEAFSMVGIDKAKKLLLLNNLSQGQAEVVKKYILDYKELQVA